jgi:hypothetical protein
MRQREKMLVPETVPFNHMPVPQERSQGQTEFMNFDYFKNKKNRRALDRKYGDNLQFCLTRTPR